MTTLFDKPNAVAHKKGWIGVDLDGTLAWDTAGADFDVLHIGMPIPMMVNRIKRWRSAGYEVRIFTARVAGVKHPPGWPTVEQITEVIQSWLEKECGLPRLLITAVKDFEMVELWDDRAVQVKRNTGMPV